LKPSTGAFIVPLTQQIHGFAVNEASLDSDFGAWVLRWRWF